MQGAIFAAREKPEEAQEEFRKALKIAEDLGNPTQLWRTHQALGNLYAKMGKGKAGQAKTRYRAALKIVRDIAGGLTDPELKEGFLQSDPIREVFAQAD